MSQTFPQYRKITGFKRYYKINHAKEFLELSFIQEKAVYQLVDAKLYPEQLRIMDMLACEAPYSPMTLEEIEHYFTGTETV